MDGGGRRGMRPRRSGSSGTGVGRRGQPGVLAHGSFTTSQTPAAPCLHRDVRPRLQELGGPLHSPDCALGPPTRPASGTGGLRACLLPSADLSVGEQRGRRAMKVSRVFSVSPTFHKLLVEGTGTQLVYHLPARSSQLHPSPTSPGPQGLPCPLSSFWRAIPHIGLRSRPRPLRHIPSLDGLQLAERGQTFREDAQDPLLNLPA